MCYLHLARIPLDSYILLKWSFKCLTYVVGRFENAMQESQRSLTMMMILCEVKENNAARGRNRT